MAINLNGKFSITWKGSDLGKSVGGIIISLDGIMSETLSGYNYVLTNDCEVSFSQYDLAGTSLVISSTLARDTSGTLVFTSSKAKITIENATPFWGDKLNIGRLENQATSPIIFKFSGPITLESV